MCQRMVRAARASRDDAGLVHALYMTAVGLASAARSEESRSLAEEALSLAHRIQNPTAVASALYARAITLEPLDPGRAASMLEQAVEHGTSVGNRWIVAFARTELISVAARRGDLDNALELAGLVVDTWHRAGDWANQWLTLRHVAGVFAAARRFRTSGRAAWRPSRRLGGPCHADRGFRSPPAGGDPGAPARRARRHPTGRARGARRGPVRRCRRPVRPERRCAQPSTQLRRTNRAALVHPPRMWSPGNCSPAARSGGTM